MHDIVRLCVCVCVCVCVSMVGSCPTLNHVVEFGRVVRNPHTQAGVENGGHVLAGALHGAAPASTAKSPDRVCTCQQQDLVHTSKNEGPGRG